MNILIDICDNLTYLSHPEDNTNLEGGDGFNRTYDTRWVIMCKCILHLLENGHTVVVRNCISDKWHTKNRKSTHRLANNGAVILEWLDEDGQEDILNMIDLYITCGFVTSRKGLNKVIRNKVENNGRNPKISYYDIGWLPDTIWIDRHKLFGESYFCEDLDKIAEDMWDERASEKFRKEVLTSKNLTSKRPQPSAAETQNLIDIRGINGKYIYMPAQKIKDGSITGLGFGMPPQSKYDVLPTLNKVAEAAIEHNVPIVIKPHPHWQCSWKDTPRITEAAQRLSAKYKHRYKGQGSFVKILNGNTQTFMRNALFSTSICSASIIDSILTQTPVFYSGKTMFHKSKCMRYDLDIHSGIDNMICNFTPDDKLEMKRYQSMILHYLNKKSLHQKHISRESFRRLKLQLGIEL